MPLRLTRLKAFSQLLHCQELGKLICYCVRFQTRGVLVKCFSNPFNVFYASFPVCLVGLCKYLLHLVVAKQTLSTAWAQNN